MTKTSEFEYPDFHTMGWHTHVSQKEDRSTWKFRRETLYCLRRLLDDLTVFAHVRFELPLGIAMGGATYLSDG